MKVYAAINAVADLLSKMGIAKNQENTHQRFMFRGIDDVYSALSRPLVDCGLRVFPRVINRETTERATAKGGIAFATILTVEYDFVSVEDGSKHTVCVVGEAADSGDKGHSKALSMAFKYACFQTFCIPVEGEEDADATTHELKPARQVERAPQPEQPQRQSALVTGERASSVAVSETAVRQKRGPSDGHPIMLQLEAALSKYGDKRPAFEQKTAEAMGVATIYDIPVAVLPQALIKVMDHQKAAAAAQKAKKQGDAAEQAADAAAKKPAAKKAPAKKADLPPPDDRQAPDMQEPGRDADWDIPR